MRKIMLTALASAAIGLVAITGAPAAPMNGAAIEGATADMNAVTQVQHWRWGSGGHWRWGSGGHWRWGSGGRRCNRWRCW